MAKELFEYGRQRLDQIVKPGTLCAFDFDGTLSPIVDQPDQARLSPEAVRRLVTLSGLAPVAVITGRSLADIGPRLQFQPDFLVGNHGMEGLWADLPRAERCRELCRGWHASLSQALQSRTDIDPKVWIENKEYSLSVHFRSVDDPVRTEQQLAALFARMTPLPRIVGGKLVANLVAPGASDKGAALEHLIKVSAAPSAIYVGDDVTDEDVFKLARGDLLSVRIEPAPGSAAPFYLDSQSDILRLLDELIGRFLGGAAQPGAHPAA
jgi:trehalose 6-phosphate phosphatase